MIKPNAVKIVNKTNIPNGYTFISAVIFQDDAFRILFLFLLEDCHILKGFLCRRFLLSRRSLMELIVLKRLRFSSFTCDEHAFQEIRRMSAGGWVGYLKTEEAAKQSDEDGRCHITNFNKILH